jgi:hypothetical protein
VFVRIVRVDAGLEHDRKDNRIVVARYIAICGDYGVPQAEF